MALPFAPDRPPALVQPPGGQPGSSCSPGALQKTIYQSNSLLAGVIQWVSAIKFIVIYSPCTNAVQGWANTSGVLAAALDEEQARAHRHQQPAKNAILHAHGAGAACGLNQAGRTQAGRTGAL